MALTTEFIDDTAAAFAEADVIESELARVDRQTNGCGAVIARGDEGDPANGGNDSREHVRDLSKRGSAA